MIYFDNAATTLPKPSCVYDAVDAYHRAGAVNAGRGAYRRAREATQMVQDVKRELLSLVDARGQAEVVFTPSVTIALNEILLGIHWEDGMNIYVSPYEHNAILRPLDLLRRRRGVRVIELPLAEDLSIDLDACSQLFSREHPALVCCTAISNVTGYVLPAPEIFRRAKEYGALTLLDGAQAVGLLRMRFSTLHCDFLSFAGHKTLYATFGIAGFYIRNGINLEESITGGNGIQSENLKMPRYMPEKLESASMDTPAIASLATSLEWLKHQHPWEYESDLMQYMLPKLRSIEGIHLYQAPGDVENQAGVISINLDGFRANEVAAILDKESDIAVRAGHHCAGLIHRHLDNKRFDGTLRISLGLFNSKEEIDQLIQALSHIDREVLKGVDASILRGNC